MRARGPSVGWLEHAVRVGDVDTAWTTARELGNVSLDHALALVVLAAIDGDRSARFNAAAARWTMRYLTLPHRPGLQELRDLTNALDELPDLTAITKLGTLCNRLQLTVASDALNHLLGTDVRQ